ncbi:MAG: lysylphosphatidylglycerol synthase domain-containing protein [Pseudomonadota bacterium]
MGRKYFLAAAVCAVVAIVGYYIIDLSVVLDFVQTFEPWPFLFYAWVSIIVSYLFKTARFAVYLRKEISLDAMGFFRLFSTSNVIFAIASFTPGQIGDILKLEYIRAERRIDRGRLYAIFVQEKILDLIALSAVVIIAVKLRGFDFFAELNATYALIAFAVFAALMGGTAVAVFMSARIRALFYRLKALIDPGALPAAIPLTAAFWFAVIWGWKEVWATHDLNFTYFETFFAIAGSTLISIVSLIPGAVGVSEVSTTAALMLFGADADDALVASLLTRAYMFTIVLNGLLFLPPTAFVLWSLGVPAALWQKKIDRNDG